VTKILTVIGARPQFIKAAAVSHEIALSSGVKEVIVHTGQHYDDNMSVVFFEQMSIPAPKYNLGIGGGPHGQMTGRQLESLERVILEETPDWVLVYGDTNSTLAGALAAAKLNIPVAHVEAGLRSFNRRMPEEVNRIVTDHVATLLLAPTEIARANLLREGVDPTAILISGDVMLDASRLFSRFASRPAWFDESSAREGRFVLCTVHRAENTDDPSRLDGILRGLGMAGMPVVLPLHPRTRDRVAKCGLKVPNNVFLADPVGYLEMAWLESACSIVATDSGGVQKEAYFHGKKCVTLRDETEWVELVDSGANVLVGADPDRIAAALVDESVPSGFPPFYGEGRAAAKVVGAFIGRGATK
jgi:UDP-GlcNAc3NAcA epimerase